MAYCNDKIWATQFHHKHYYKFDEQSAIHQRAWLDNFIELTKMFDQDKLNNGHKIENYLKSVHNCLYT